MPELSAAPRQEILECHRLYQCPLCGKIDLETIASQIHLSKYYFCRIFREVTGATVLEYLTNVRLTRAGRLLVESSLAIQEIAQKTGLRHWCIFPEPTAMLMVSVPVIPDAGERRRSY